MKAIIKRFHETNGEDGDNGRSLFLFYATHLVHTPLQIPQAVLDKFAHIDGEERRLMRAMAFYLDLLVGEIADTLKQYGMWEDTLLVFHSDNGGQIVDGGGSNNYPLRTLIER